MIFRRKGLVAFIVFFMTASFCYAQKWRNQTDSLLKAYSRAPDPHEKVNLLCDAARIFLFQNPDTSLILSNEAAAIAKKSGDDVLLAAAYASISSVYLINDNNDKTLEYAVKGLKISEHTPLPNDIMASLCRKFGYVYRNTHRTLEGIQFYKRALQYSIASGNQQDVSGTYSNIGNLFVSINQFDSALHYFDSALIIAKRIHFLDIIVRSSINIMNAHNGLHQYPQAFATVRAMEPYVNDPEQTPIVKGLAYTAIANLDLRHGANDHPLAAKYLDSMKHLIAITSPGNDNMVDYYLNRSILEFSNKHFDSAAALLEKYTEYKKNRDEEIMSGHAQELATRYETGKKEARIKELDEQSRFRQTLLIITLSAATVFLALLFWVWRQNKQIKKQESHVNYLMKELHHRVKNNLQIVSSLLNLQSLRIEDEQARKALMEGQHRIEAMSLIHQKLYQTDTSSQVNIQEFIAELSENLMHAYGYTDVNFDLQLQIQVKELDADMAIPVGLIVNEVVTNAFKYAYKEVQRPSLHIVFNTTDNQLLLTVADNGSVLTEKAWKQSASFGRQLIQTLTQQLQGTLQLTCNNNTAFNFTFPFKPALS